MTPCSRVFLFVNIDPPFRPSEPLALSLIKVSYHGENCNCRLGADWAVMGDDLCLGRLPGCFIRHQAGASQCRPDGYVRLLRGSLKVTISYSKNQLDALTKSGLLRGTLTASEQMALITGTDQLAAACKDAVHVQECVPESAELKKKVFASIAAAVNDRAVICSSTSCLMPSLIFGECGRTSQCIIAHPVNPPYYAPMVEIIPHDLTTQSVRQRTRDLMSKIKQKPVLLNREIDGFALNRIQYAVINESWRLVQDGIMSPQDVDTVLTAGLGMRYAVIGELLK